MDYRDEILKSAEAVGDLLPDSRSDFEFGCRAVIDGRLDDAVGHFLRVLQGQSDNVTLQLDLGLLFLEKSDLPHARIRFRKAIGLEPDNARAHEYLGDTYDILCDLKGAIREYQQASELDPLNGSLRIKLAKALYQSDNERYALEYRTALGTSPEDGQAVRAIADLLFDDGRLDEAIDGYRALVALAPDDPCAHFSLGDAYFWKGAHKKALAEVREAMRLKPGWPYYHNKLGQMLEALGRTDEAFREYREAVRLKPDLDDARANLRRLKMRQTAGGRRARPP